MPLKLSTDNINLQIKVIASPDFDRDQDLIRKIMGRKPKYDAQDRFLHWEVPKEALGYILQTWGEGVMPDSSARNLIDRYKEKLLPIDQLPRGELKVTSLDGKIPKPYQLSYITLPESKQVLLASYPTGSGKSLSSALRASQIGFSRLLIVGPKKLRVNWRTTIREVLGKETLIYWGRTPKSYEKLDNEVKESSVIYCTYESLSKFKKIHKNIEFDSVIIDEIHSICNPKTEAHKEVFSLLRATKGQIQGLSATPMRLKLEDLWGVLRLLDPEVAGSKSAFLDQYQEVLATMPIKKNGHTFHVPIKVRTKNEGELRKKLSSIMVRVNKEDIVDFKDNIEIIDVELTPRQLSVYTEILTTLQVELQDRTLLAENPLARMTRLLQVSEGLFNIDPSRKDSGKLEFLKEELKEKLKAGEKVIVWSRFEPITRLIKEAFPQETVLYTGKTSEGLKDLAVWAFQGVTDPKDKEEYERLCKHHPDFPFKPGEAKIFSGTHSDRSGMGINLPAAHITYFTSYDWRGTTIQQARDRMSRLTQTEDTETYFLVADNTIERKALKLILDNYAKCSNVLDGGRTQESKLTQELIKLLWN